MSNRLIGMAMFIPLIVVACQVHAQVMIENNSLHHLFATMLITLFFAILSDSLLVGMLVSLAIGVGKELIDPTISSLDLFMDLVGVLVAATIVEIYLDTRRPAD